MVSDGVMGVVSDVDGNDGAVVIPSVMMWVLLSVMLMGMMVLLSFRQ
jgi:hypothetical protein